MIPIVLLIYSLPDSPLSNSSLPNRPSGDELIIESKCPIHTSTQLLNTYIVSYTHLAWLHYIDTNTKSHTFIITSDEDGILVSEDRDESEREGTNELQQLHDLDQQLYKKSTQIDEEGFLKLAAEQKVISILLENKCQGGSFVVATNGVDKYRYVPPRQSETDFYLPSTEGYVDSGFKASSQTMSAVISKEDAVLALQSYCKQVPGATIDTDKVLWALPSIEAQKQCGYDLLYPKAIPYTCTGKIVVSKIAVSLVLVCDEGVAVTFAREMDG